MGSIILAGGRSSRMGQDKISLVIEGEYVLRRIINTLRNITPEIILVLARDQGAPPIPPGVDIRIVNDIHRGKGPLVGLYSGLRASNNDACLVVACDMPLLDEELLRYMKSLATQFDVVIPRDDKGVEPLHAVYSQKCLPFLQKMIETNDLKVKNLLDRVKVRYLEGPEIDAFDPYHRSWFNINTRADLQTATQIIKREKSK